MVPGASSSKHRCPFRDNTLTRRGRMITKVAKTELLTEIAQMIVDGNISLAAFPIHSLFTPAQARLNRSSIRYTNSTTCTARTIS